MKLTHDWIDTLAHIGEILLLLLILIVVLETTPKPVSVFKEPFPQVVTLPCPMFDRDCTGDAQIAYVVKAMRVMASSEKPGDLDALMTRWGTDAPQLARIILNAAQDREIDPLLLVVMAWTETRFNPKATSDYVNRPLEGKNCGLLQVRTDLPGRPSCDSMKDPGQNLAWATTYISTIKSNCGGKICLNQYNAGDYESRIWRTLDWLRRQMWIEESR